MRFEVNFTKTFSGFIHADSEDEAKDLIYRNQVDLEELDEEDTSINEVKKVLTKYVLSATVEVEFECEAEDEEDAKEHLTGYLNNNLDCSVDVVDVTYEEIE